MADEETQLNKLKAAVKNWREIILPISSVILWEKPWHPCALIGGMYLHKLYYSKCRCDFILGTTILFMSIWLLDPSLLTAISIIGLTITISDYIVPLLTASMMKGDTWSEKKEKQLDEVCLMLLKYFNVIVNRASTFCELRTFKPKLYYSCTIIVLMLLAWIGNNINNLFLTYLLVVAILLLPGMEQNGIINVYTKILTQKIGDMAQNTKIKIGQIKSD
ncbi:hypothetical protein AMK59_5964 [Oryctes borbonicus]|uniref:RETREG1-3/ARL6IP-like N-terminal reticulon-homology domain-containing protein n=1 Tax=Oryctes borbonicus TaxID=1629725 RepID=A0A0T6B2N5_9SCAR|nr:hypothetical protein AMK59_5964 [Oryctes borbonicus]